MSTKHVDIRMFECDDASVDADYADASALLKALAHPARLQIVTELRDRDHCVHELVDSLGLAQPTVSQHLQVLRAARLVDATRVGREHRYTLTDHHVGRIADDALAHVAEPPGRTRP